MALEVRNIPDEVVYALVAAHNQRQVDAISTLFHLAQTEETNRPDYKDQSVTRVRVSSADATDLTTAIVRANEILSDLNQHFRDEVAHNTAVSAQIATPEATDLTSCITLGNAEKAAFNTHRTASNVHYTNDATNTVSSADATDQTTLLVLLNEMDGDLNAHFASAPSGTVIDIKPA